MPVPQGIISTTTGPVNPDQPKVEEVVVEVAVEEVAEKPAPKKRASKI
jgi:hypothetical protein